MPVPEITPSWPVIDTSRASCQDETATPIPPWITTGSVLGANELSWFWR